jgi:PAS domain S-box-containing protein
VLNGLIKQDLFSDETEFFTEVLKSAGVGFWTYDHATDSNVWSAQLLALLGGDEGDVPKGFTEWFDLIHPEDQPRVQSSVEGALQLSNPLYDVQFRYRHGQGHWVWLHSRGQVLKRNPDGSPLLTAGITSDISQLKQVESALSRTDSRFSELVEHIPVGVYTLSTPGTIEQSSFTFVSNRLCQLLGLDRSALMMDASMAFKLAIPDENDRWIKANQDAFLSKQSFHFEGQFQICGEHRWLRINAHPTAQTDELTLWDGVVIDITDGKRAEVTEKLLYAELETWVAARMTELAAATAQVQFSEERLRHALEASNTGVMDWNIQTGEAFYLFPPVIQGDQLPAEKAFELWKSLVHPDDLDRVLTFMAGHLTSADDYTIEYRLHLPGGRYHWVLAKGKVVGRDAAGNPLRIIGTHTDIDARKRADRLNKQLALVIESSSDLIATGASDGRLLYGNATCRHLLGCSDEDPIESKHIRDAHPEWAYRRVMEKGIPTALREGSWQGDTVFLSQDGSEKEFSQLILAPRDPETGEVEFMATICRDISERRRLEDAIRDRNEALELADRHKTEFLATLAHELRNPMSPLLIAAQQLHENGADNHNLPWIADLIGRQVTHLSRLVDDLLDVARITQGKIRLDRQFVDLSILLPQAIQMVLPNIEARHHQLALKLPEEPIHVDGDPVRLVQVVANLLNNAAKFTEPGGQLALTLDQRDDQAVITVNDNGCGIEPGSLNQVFELFTQVNGKAHQPNGGLGVGLNLSQKLIQKHGGTIKATSQESGRGSEFVIQLPRVSVAKMAATDHPSVPRIASNGSKRILVVDDNVDAADSLMFMLQQKGHDVRIAHDGNKALECIRIFNPEVIFLDIGMPGMDGYEVCRQIRASTQGQRMHICAVTGWGQSEDKNRAHEAGFDDHLTKPVTINDIMSQISGYRLGDELD